jgi:hypothetical protein
VGPIGDPGFVDTGGDGGIGTPTETPSGSPPAPTTPIKSVRLVEASVYTKGVAGGAVRFALPILLVIGLVALAAAFRKPRLRLRTASAGAPASLETVAPASAPAPPPPPPAPGPPAVPPSSFEPW